jgi:hypothetical protein
MQERRLDGEVRIFDDHRDTLTVDVQSDLVMERAAQMRSEHSEAAMLWNVFRALQKIDAGVWLPRFVRQALPEAERAGWLDALLSRPNLAEARFDWWRRFDLPPGRHAWLRDAAQNACLHLDHYVPRNVTEKKAEAERRLAADLPLEEPVELPLCIETPAWILGVLAVYKGNLRRHTTFDARRDEVLRVLDAGTFAAAASGRRFLCIVVCTDTHSVNLETVRLVERYRGRSERLVEALPHHEDAAALADAAGGLGVLRWRDLGSLLVRAKDEERLGVFDVAALDELIRYLARKDVGFNFFRRLK